MTFAHPAYFLLLVLFIPLVLWYMLMRRHYEPALRFSATEAFRHLPLSPRVLLVHLPFILRLVIFLLIIIVLARPQTSIPQSRKEVKGIDIMIAMDISISMLTPDLLPNRMEAAKQVAYEFIASRKNDNIGLTLFGGEAFTQCPMTTDHAALLSTFRNVSCELQSTGVISEGTAIGMGLTNAVSRLMTSNAPSKVVILITDGANNTGDISPLTAAEMAQKKGVRIYTIAVGKQGVVKQPVGMLPNGELYYANVQSDMDPITLKAIAKTTGGLYYAADSEGKLREIYKDIDRLEQRKLAVHHLQKRYEAYLPFAVAAFVLLILEILLSLTWLRRIP
ncbi:VWA domain-containing protein [Alloprevotella sp. OH1205_COT-284]|uniref:vWA domain-containing protein n=1 Tax=Alloprevotella sp. OH1205_COT-284 TaxID=2491043 RepID=UPI000F5EACDE|nr:VWA domain-containing protein [Alloprevotella sp. OH1205_COT-284]RRD77023.1 VWA domain-containing protein [Alloprevotella sp. OH1205_COT-284]